MENYTIGSVFIEDAVFVRIDDDHELCMAFLEWLIEHPEVLKYRGGESGLGNFVGWFPSVHKNRIVRFFEEVA
jgi:hypothetical protein